ncbi:MAG TPA: hypothetical protein VFP65_07720 [Anaeromyxobacteraceae bacterium]|nr:hypothetical protein [Anaeromyxobacteraceae bacterium]
MRVNHLQGTSATDRVVPRCGAWGSMDSDWTDVAANVSCVACRDAMRDDARDDRRVEEASTRGLT